MNSHEFAIAVKSLNKAIYYFEVCGVVLLAINRHSALTRSIPRYRRVSIPQGKAAHHLTTRQIILALEQIEHMQIHHSSVVRRSAVDPGNGCTWQSVPLWRAIWGTRL